MSTQETNQQQPTQEPLVTHSGGRKRVTENNDSHHFTKYKQKIPNIEYTN